jgi:hypothetical protein
MIHATLGPVNSKERAWLKNVACGTTRSISL